jgi:hypothetical protein
VIPGWFVILAGLATILPYLLVGVIPGTDYPNDLARLAILGAAPGAAIRQSFVPHWALMPDLGLDLVYMALKSVASPACVLRLCLAGAMASMLSLIWLIQRDLFGRPSFAAALAIPCMGGLPVVLGFTNFVMSSALVLLGVWLWLRWRENLSWPRVLALAAVSALTWLCHVAGYALLMAFLGCGQFWLFARRPSLASLFRNAASLAVITLPGLVLFGFAERETVPMVNVAWRSYAIRGLFAPTMVTGDPSDLLIWLGMVVIIGVILAKGRWFVAPPARLSLAVLTAGDALFSALPGCIPRHTAGRCDRPARDDGSARPDHRLAGPHIRGPRTRGGTHRIRVSRGRTQHPARCHIISGDRQMAGRALQTCQCAAAASRTACASGSLCHDRSRGMGAADLYREGQAADSVGAGFRARRTAPCAAAGREQSAGANDRYRS